MAKRRRSRALGGSPEHHESMARALSQTAVDFYEMMRKTAQAGDCASAFQRMDSAARDDGKFRAHVTEVARATRVPKQGGAERPESERALIAKLAKLRDSAYRAFKSKCLVKKGRR